ncbi:MAG: hypothetical protein K6U89_04030 [Chloroflexi bacterium]|nr:hypothetical protein [Chloroflexota bacterium]
MARSWRVGLVPILAAGTLVLGTTAAFAHGGVDDVNDGEPGEGGGGTVPGTPLEELYPGYYQFQHQFVAFGSTWLQNRPLTITVPAQVTPPAP